MFFGLSYFVPFIRVLAILFGIAWVAYAKSLILLWGEETCRALLILSFYTLARWAMNRS